MTLTISPSRIALALIGVLAVLTALSALSIYLREVAALADGCCDDLLDAEYRTACRRLLADAAAGNPDVFRRRGRADTAAAAIVWIVLHANDGFSQRPGGLTAKAVGEWFGVSNAGQRAPTLLKAVAAPGQYPSAPRLGSPRYLVADRRRTIVERRDRAFQL